MGREAMRAAIDTGNRRAVTWFIAQRMSPLAFDNRFWTVNGRRLRGQPIAKQLAFDRAARALGAMESLIGRVVVAP